MNRFIRGRFYVLIQLALVVLIQACEMYKLTLLGHLIFSAVVVFSFLSLLLSGQRFLAFVMATCGIVVTAYSVFYYSFSLDILTPVAGGFILIIMIVVQPVFWVVWCSSLFFSIRSVPQSTAK